MLSKNLCSSNEPYPICHMNIKKGVKCSICKKIFHTYCMAEWFKQLVIKRCPVCRSDSWNITFNFFVIY